MRGLIAWMARHPVAANLLMLLIVVAAQGLRVPARVIVSDLKVVTDGMRVREVGTARRPAP